MITKVDENGVLRYTTDRDMSQIIDDCADDMDSDLCSIIQYETCGDGGTFIPQKR